MAARAYGRPSRPLLNFVLGVTPVIALAILLGGRLPWVGAAETRATHAFRAAISAHGGKDAPHGPSAAQAARAVAFAEAQIGKPYVYGAPRWTAGAPAPASYDCSSLAQWAWAAAGITIPGTSETQWAQLPHVPLKDAKPGDLVFETGYLEPGEQPPGHVVIYLGHGKIIEAYGTGYPVRITRLRRADAWSQVAVPALTD